MLLYCCVVVLLVVVLLCVVGCVLLVVCCWLCVVGVCCGGCGAEMSVAEMSLSIPQHEHAPNSGGRTPGSQDSRRPRHPGPHVQLDGGRKMHQK